MDLFIHLPPPTQLDRPPSSGRAFSSSIFLIHKGCCFFSYYFHRFSRRQNLVERALLLLFFLLLFSHPLSLMILLLVVVVVVVEGGRWLTHSLLALRHNGNWLSAGCVRNIQIPPQHGRRRRNKSESLVNWCQERNKKKHIYQLNPLLLNTYKKSKCMKI